MTPRPAHTRHRAPPALRNRRLRVSRRAALLVAAVTIGVAAFLSTANALGDNDDGHRPASSRAKAAGTTSPPTTPPPTLPPTTPAPTTTTTTVAEAPAGPLAAGQWRPIGLLVNGAPTLTAGLFQGVAGRPLTGVVRINGALTKPVLYAGTGEPGGSWADQGAIGTSRRTGLVAAFNAGFHTYGSGGGWFDAGRTAVPLRAGAASMVIRADGSATVGMFGRDVTLSADVVSVRQNLTLLVDAGADQSAAGSWGAVLGGGSVTWRSGLGVDGAGNLIYAGGPGLDPHGLAQVLIQAGAVRGMELDINPQWVSFSYYGVAGSGVDLLPNMYYGPSHWLSGSSRDFFAIVTR